MTGPNPKIRKEACFDNFYGSQALAEKFLSGLSKADSIVVLGATCNAQGLPNPSARMRCEAEVSLSLRLPNHKWTIVSGGSFTVPKEYLQVDPAATEAGLLIQHCQRIGGHSKYLAENCALTTIGNIVMASTFLLDHELRQPVFVSQVAHLDEYLPVIKHWFGRSSIEPMYWPLRAPPKKENLTAEEDRRILEQQQERHAERFNNSNNGDSYMEEFIRNVGGLGDDLRTGHQKIRTAMGWLFSTDHLDRYRRHYGDLQQMEKRK